MKTNKKLLKTQRKSLDLKLNVFASAKREPRPKSGWIRAIRQALGMSTQQLANRMGIQQSGVMLLEAREQKKAVTLETLEKAARALNCELVYALVPKQSLEKTLDEQAVKSARKILQRTLHTMSLEQQEVGAEESAAHEKELALELKAKMDRRLWGAND